MKHRRVFPRIRQLPDHEREAFSSWLEAHGAVRPLIPGVPIQEQDGYFEQDFQNWKEGKLPIFI